MSSEFVLHIKDSNDYRFLSFEKKSEIVELILKIMCKELGLCSAFPIYYVPSINLNGIMTTHKLFKKKNIIRP